MDEDDPRNRRLTFGRGCDWKAPDVSPELFPGSPLPNFATPQARYDYERGLAEREFRVRLKTAGNWGFVQIQGLDINLKDAGLAAHELSMVTAGFLDQSLRASLLRAADDRQGTQPKQPAQPPVSAQL